jgi:MHS family proline/betaine transporter-like MFS transporter
MCVALFGGTAPLIVTFLIDKTGSPFAPAYYIVLTAIITLFFALRLKNDMSALATPELVQESLKSPLQSV